MQYFRIRMAAILNYDRHFAFPRWLTGFLKQRTLRSMCATFGDSFQKWKIIPSFAVIYSTIRLCLWSAIFRHGHQYLWRHL